MAEQVKVRVITADENIYEYWTFLGKNLWDTMAANGIDIGGVCGGTGYCGKCKVRVEGLVNELSEAEREKLLPEEIKAGMRLACYCTIMGSVDIYPDNREFYSDVRANMPVNHTDCQPDELVKTKSIFIPGLDKNNPVPIYSRLAKALSAYKLDLSPANINELALIDRVGRPSLELQALIFDNKVVKYVGRKKETAFGIALDLGTTSLFAALVDLESGQTLEVSAKTNMQRIYGADIISRVSYCLQNPEGMEKLHQILINNINSMIEDMVKNHHISARQIYRFVVVGNPVMLHFLTGLNVTGFAAAPYTGLFDTELRLKANSLGINANKDAEIIVLPQIGGFVGADTISCLLVLDTDSPSCYLLIDIGTNGEIVLFNHGKMWAVSAAAGPAFEGGSITCGTRAGNGSIDKVYLDDDENLVFNIIGNRPVRGMCGSAIIDLTAALLKAGYIDDKGIISNKAYEKLKVLMGNRGSEIVIYEESDVLKGSPVVFNQEDIRQVQLAKSAIRTGIELLLKNAGLRYNDIDNIYLAGAFGNYLNAENCIIIGLLPEVDPVRVINIGNAAANGAIAALLSAEMRQKAIRLKGNIQYVEIALEPDFQDRFINNLNF